LVDLVECLRAAQVDQDLKGLAAQSAWTLTSDVPEAWKCLATEAFDDGLNVTPYVFFRCVEGVGQKLVDTPCSECDQGVLGCSAKGAIWIREVSYEGANGLWHEAGPSPCP
jgi:hypothetical protein